MILAPPSMTPGQAWAVIRSMKPGDALQYHTGDLIRDRQRSPISLDKLAKFMLSAGLPEGFRFSKGDEPIAGLGLGGLTQRKIGANVYEYIFTKS